MGRKFSESERLKRKAWIAEHPGYTWKEYDEFCAEMEREYEERVRSERESLQRERRKVEVDALARRPHGWWWEHGATHRSVIGDLFGHVPESWETLKGSLLGMPGELEVVDYLLDCVTKVEDGQGDPQWVTLPGLICNSA